MCGICGFSAGPDENIEARALSRHMLLGIEERGRHATGVAWNNSGETWLSNEAVPANQFVSSLPRSLKGTNTFIGHTRWATQGSPTNNDNNHPISTSGIVGVHNGVIFNDDDLFDRIGPEKRIAQVDSEAIFAYIAHSGLPITEALSHLEGSAAIAWYDCDNPDLLHLARVSSSPLVVAETTRGSLMFASTESCLRRSAHALQIEFNNMMPLPAGVYLKVQAGSVVEQETIKVVERSLTSVERQALSV